MSRRRGPGSHERLDRAAGGRDHARRGVRRRSHAPDDGARAARAPRQGPPAARLLRLRPDRRRSAPRPHADDAQAAHLPGLRPRGHVPDRQLHRPRRRPLGHRQDAPDALSGEARGEQPDVRGSGVPHPRPRAHDRAAQRGLARQAQLRRRAAARLALHGGAVPGTRQPRPPLRAPRPDSRQRVPLRADAGLRRRRDGDRRAGRRQRPALQPDGRPRAAARVRAAAADRDHAAPPQRHRRQPEDVEVAR